MGKREQRAERRANDHYVTPDWAIRRFLEVYQPPAPTEVPPRGLRILDPCAAAGELIQVAQTLMPSAIFAACDIDPQFEPALCRVAGDAVVIGDFLENIELLQSCQFDLILTNPPYNQAIEFIRASLEVAPIVAMLLRVNFLAGRERRDYLSVLRPAVLVLPNRPSFTGDGGDMTEYAWFVFGDDEIAGQVDILPNTPIEEIRAAKKRARIIHAPKAPKTPAALAAEELYA